MQVIPVAKQERTAASTYATIALPQTYATLAAGAVAALVEYLEGGTVAHGRSYVNAAHALANLAAHAPNVQVTHLLPADHFVLSALQWIALHCIAQQAHCPGLVAPA